MSDRNPPPPRVPTIVIIDDDVATATDLQTLLNAAGYGVRRAGTGNEGLATLAQAQADLIVLSLLLPDADGLVLCSALKTQFPVPIIVLSSRPGDVDRALAIESGALDLVTKPVDVDRLVSQVRSVVSTPSSGISAR